MHRSSEETFPMLNIYRFVSSFLTNRCIQQAILHSMKNYQLSNKVTRFQLSPCWHVLFSRESGTVSNGNLSAFDVTGSKARETTGDYIATIGNEIESSPWYKHRHFTSKTLSPNLCHTQLIIVESRTPDSHYLAFF